MRAYCFDFIKKNRYQFISVKNQLTKD